MLTLADISSAKTRLMQVVQLHLTNLSLICLTLKTLATNVLNNHRNIWSMGTKREVAYAFSASTFALIILWERGILAKLL